MATTGKLNGRFLRIYVDGNAVADATSHDLESSQSSRDVTTKDSAGWMQILPGLKEWSTSGDGLVALDAAYTITDLTTLLLDGTQVTVRFTTNTTGDVYWTGSAYVESVSISSPNEETPTYNFSLKGTGALTQPTLT